MSARHPSKETREIILLARRIGWQQIGFTGSGHVLLQHENGRKYSIAGSPGNNRNRANAIAMLERIGERKLEHAQSKSRKKAG